MLHRASPRIAAVAVMFLAACGGGGDSTAPCAVSAVTVSPTTAGIRVGATSQLSASVTAQNCSATPSVAWSTGDAGVATVSSSGLVTAVAAGTTTISATAQSMQSGSVITVTLIPVQSVVVTAPSTSMSVGATSQAVAAVRDTTGATVTRPLTWTTSAAGVATVSAAGLVTAVGPGAATITASAGGVGGSLAFTVVAAVSSVTTSLTPNVLFVGTTRRPNASAAARDAGGATLTGRTITWSSTNTAVATVNATTGEVTALAVGTTNIRATVEGVTGQSALTVSALPAANNRFGYAWNQLPAAPIDSVYTPFALYTANASGGAISMRRTAVGRYELTFDGLANANTSVLRETVLVTPYGGVNVHCGVGSWSSANTTDLLATVLCTDLPGAPLNASFQVAVIGSTSLDGSFGFLWTPSGAGGAITPRYAFSTGAGAVTYSRASMGSYTVNYATAPFTNGSQVISSPYGDPLNRYCWNAGWNDAGSSSNFQCAASSDNTLADAEFTSLMFDRGRAGKRWGYAWNSSSAAVQDAVYTPSPFYQRQSNGQNVTMKRSGIGAYTVTFTGLGRGAGQTDVVLVSTYGNSSFAHCTVTSWNGAGADLTADVRCVDRRTQVSANASFTIFLLE
jgi:uncharacterized protein YjdB